ncbi:MAG: AmmeMemoRadiSam system protein B [Proteobacteria bacterium]|nr:AmmeMemoRadiSam system protein B [Pseudomonadota bacterium]
MIRFAIVVVLLLEIVGCSEPKPALVKTSDAETSSRNSAAANEEKNNNPKPKNVSQRVENAYPPQVAGAFYTDNPEELREQVKGFLDAASSSGVESKRDIVGILTPHAGYRYSGPVAGEAYRAVMGRDYRTVIVLALSHRQKALKASVLDRPAYDTPLGSLKIDRRLVRRLLSDHKDVFEANEKVFKGEHSLEVQLPFIQVALPETKVVPIIIALHDPELISRAGAALHEVFGKRGDVLFAMSSDLSHYFPYKEAVEYDKETLGLLEKWKIDEWSKIAPSQKGMCGYAPTLTFVRMFEKYDIKIRKVTRLAYKNSGDTSGDRARGVVGYGALAFSLENGMRKERGSEKDFSPFSVKDRRYLMDLAKKAVTAAAKGEPFKPEKPTSKFLAEQGAAFVTLKKGERLRGCIGHVIARIPLFQCIADVARSATIHDTRFSPVSQDELKDLNFEISVLTAPEPITPQDVVVGRDGLIMSRGSRSGLLLPQVPIEWDWNREEFLAHTCRKAGLPLDCWKDPDTKIESFRAIVWGEDDLDD